MSVAIKTLVKVKLNLVLQNKYIVTSSYKRPALDTKPRLIQKKKCIHTESTECAIAKTNVNFVYVVFVKLKKNMNTHRPRSQFK